MESTKGLTEATSQLYPAGEECCPACGVSGADSAPVKIGLLGGAALRRCTSCGSRRLASSGEPSEGVRRFDPLLEESLGGELPEPGLVEATEVEVRRALASAWRFVAGTRANEYLDRVVRSAARAIEGAPGDCRVLLVDDSRVRRLALPSGRILLSLGALRSIEDEAELVFVLGHELAHVASGDSARWLVEVGLVELARGAGGPDQAAWLRIVDDMLGLGFGSENEQRADLQGVRAVLSLGYDPESVIRYLERLGQAIEEDGPRMAENALAHPLPADRLRRVRRSWGVHLRDPGASRVNRDAYRRAVGHSALLAELQESADLAEGFDPGGRARPWGDWRVVGTVVAILLLASLFLVLGLTLAH